MSTLTARLNATKNTEKMYSVDGATFQEWATNRIDFKGSQAHMTIGSLVTAINNNRISVDDAKATFFSLLSK